MFLVFFYPNDKNILFLLSLSWWLLNPTAQQNIGEKKQRYELEDQDTTGFVMADSFLMQHLYKIKVDWSTSLAFLLSITHILI